MVIARATASMAASLRPAILGALLLLSQLACDPCTGVANCSTDGAYLAVTGRIVDRLSGAAVDGARIDVVRVFWLQKTGLLRREERSSQ